MEENLLALLESHNSIRPDFTDQEKLLLSALATGDRKIDSAIKKSSLLETQGHKSLESLVQEGVIQKEHSRERPPQKSHPKQKLKKSLRRYRIQHKAKFAKPFHRFWFRYIYPSWDLLEASHYEKVLRFILSDRDNFVSYIFEELCNEMIQERFGQNSGSYWDKKVELDILLDLPNGKKVVGECKWKNSKICKKTLTSLQKKCEILNLDVEYFALFSKSSFSNELLKTKSKNLLLFDLEDFKEWSRQSTYKKREKTPYSFEF